MRGQRQPRHKAENQQAQTQRARHLSRPFLDRPPGSAAASDWLQASATLSSAVDKTPPASVTALEERDRTMVPFAETDAPCPSRALPVMDRTRWLTRGGV